jgi:hypothetical protein
MQICGEPIEGSIGELSKHTGEFHKGEMSRHRKDYPNSEPVNKWADLKDTTATFWWRNP